METNLIPSAEKSDMDIVRIETALSRYPIHRLANKGTISIQIQRKDAAGATALRWEVDYSNRYGQPGPLAYKLDTLVINRRIDESGRPVPRSLRLGSLHDIALELNLDRNTAAVKKALLQNVGAIINAKITYRGVDRSERSVEAAFNRYSVVFTGKKLPNGTVADGVYLILNDVYAEVLDNAMRRPLDYDYLRKLSPGSQRFYEIVSYEMLPAIKYGQRAKLPYSEFCLYSTMTRYDVFEQVKKQMWKIHQPHVTEGYIAKVEYEAIVDEAGRPDWNMFYLPGETARRQQLTFDFTTPANRPPRIKPAPPVKTPPLTPKLTAPQLTLIPTDVSPQPKAGALVRRFYKLRYGAEQEPTARELAEATQRLAEGEEGAFFLIDFAARQGKETNGFPNEFGGTKKLASQAQERFEMVRQKQSVDHLKKARQSHQDAHRGAYHAFLGELLRGRLETSLPGAFSAFSTQEASTYQFHKARAPKSPMSAQTVQEYYDEEKRVARLLKFIEENPQSGIPNFWQWDEKLNPQPFRET